MNIMLPRRLRRPLAAAAIALLSISAVEAQTFSHQGVSREAQRYETWLKVNARPGALKARELRLAAEKALPSDPRAAVKSYSMAVVAEPADAEAWLGLARAMLAIPANALASNERYEMPANASAAALLAFERASTPKAKAAALASLGEALKRRSYWRPAIDALKASLALEERTEVRQSFEALRAEHGFRLIDYKAEVEAAQPRLCLQFSEGLARAPTDLAKFLSVDGRDPQSLVIEGRQLCLEGLAHGRRYEVRLRAGLPSETGETLLKASELSVLMQDRAASVRATGRSYVLPSRGQNGIPLVTVNTDKVAVEVYRVGDRSLATALTGGDLMKQLAGHDLEALRERTGARIYSGTLEVGKKLNEEVTTAVPVSEAVGGLKPGVYALVAKPSGTRDDDDARATQWFIVSDLGLTAFTGDDGIHAFVRSLASAEPAAAAAVKLVARNNEVLGTAKTDASGYARFEAGLKRGEGGMAPAVLVAEAAGGDYAFLDLTTTAFDLTDRGVKGRDQPGPLDAYLYTERGVYRPGETVHLSGLLRDRTGKASALPVTLIVVRPDGVEHRRVALPDQGLGGRTSALVLTGSAMTGTWRARLHADPKADPLASVAFLVEDFVPERLDLKLEPAARTVAIEETAAIKVTGRYLYGPPAASLALEGDIVVKAATGDIEGFAGYQFGRAEEKITAVRKALEALPQTDKDGKAELAIALPAIPRTSRPLTAEVMVRLREPGGRGIERSIMLPVDARMARVGIKPLFKGGEVPESTTAEFDVVLLGADGKVQQPKSFKWELLRLENHWQWYSRDGAWAYEATTSTRKVASGTATPTAAGPASRISARTDWGRYRLEVSSDEAPGAVSSVGFRAGWYGEDGADSPETLEVALDKPSYAAGDTAKLKIVSRTGGKALVSVLGGGLHATKQVDIPRGGGEVAIPVEASWGAGAYVTAMLYRPMDEAAKRMPGRALGIRWLGLDTSARTLQVGLDLPAKVRSASTLTVPVKVGGLAAGEEARITLAAVDVGILNLTRFKDPAPEAWFYAQRKLGTEIRDLYGRLIDGMRAERGRLRSGGDGGSGMSTSGSPPTEALLALFSGIVRVAPDGTAKVDLALPEFNGAVRVMAVAWSGDKLGHGAGEVIVRDAVALLASGPRFLTLGDEARLALDMHNVEGPDGSYRAVVEQEVPGGGASTVLSQAIALKAGERRRERLSLEPKDLGRQAYTVRITGPAGIDVTRKLAIDVRPPAGDIRSTVTSQLSARGGKLTLSADLLTDMIPARTRVNLSIGPIAGLDVPGLLTGLDRYPYGCAEQTTSRALPLLYANQLSVAAGLPKDGELKERVQKAVDRVLEMQDATGAFGIWGPRNGDLWLTSYVTDFLSRAREQGFAVKPQAFAQALDRLQNYIAYAQDFEKGGEARAYALYVLARNGRAPIGDVRYYADARLDRFATPLAKAQLGAALAMLGEKERAEKVFKAAMTGFNPASDGARIDYGSGIRDGAALIALASEARVAREEAPRLAAVLAKAFASRTYTSTQEQAWMLLAANALADQSRDVALKVNGLAHKGSYTRMLTAAEVKAGVLTIVNEGEAVNVLISVVGAALTPEPAVAKGFTITRSAYTLDGKPLELKSLAGGTGQIKQTERLVMVLKVEAKEAGGRILLVDRLPAGLEIENPRLVDSGDVKSLDWLKGSIKPEHTEFRDDRFVAAFNFSDGDRAGRRNRGDADRDDPDDRASGPQTTATVAYIVRAVTPGSYVHPAATVEDMYRPERHARTAAGRLDVTAKE